MFNHYALLIVLTPVLVFHASFSIYITLLSLSRFNISGEQKRCIAILTALLLAIFIRT